VIAAILASALSDHAPAIVDYDHML